MAKKNQPKPTTLDDLAAMINRGFTETQQYIDKRLGGMDQRLDMMDQQMDDLKGVFKDIVQELTATHEDVRYIRTTVNLLVRNDAAQDAAMCRVTADMRRLFTDTANLARPVPAGCYPSSSRHTTAPPVREWLSHSDNDPIHLIGIKCN